MATSGKEGSLARRLRELEEEERRLRQSMKEVNRHMRKIERGAADSFESRTAAALRAPPPAAPETAPTQAEVETVAGRPAAPRRVGPRESDKFASYFSSGSFVKPRTLGRERRVQRNKAIFMLIFVGLVGYLVYHLVF
ncbi:MAG TPA: hypothetical protein PKE12_04560 [Kiritimatiellia bacterium]|nr:hypothetical protein [Kiritimatiellia bacterium]